MYVPTQSTTCDIEFQYTGSSTFVGEAWAIATFESGKVFRCGVYQKKFYTPQGFEYFGNDVNEKTTAHGVCTVDSTISLFICSQHREPEGDVFTASSQFRIYSCVIYDGGNAVRSFVPCYNKNAEEYGLYDTVESVFYGSSGTGKFYGKSFLEEETYKVFDYDQYFVDHEMSNNIATTTITGSGAIDDPYIINSSEDFWWASKYLVWQNKYVEFASDVAINDEIFDEQGNFRGGDGTIYRWERMRFWGYVQGNERCISGCYMTGSSRHELVSVVANVENLFLDNFYLYCSTMYGGASGLCHEVSIIKNVHTLGGFIKCDGLYGSGIAANVTVRAENCSNNAKINAQDSGGLFGSTGKDHPGVVIENCVNYANMQGNRLGGIICETSLDLTIRNCKNYGEIQGASGGIMWTNRKGLTTIIDCVNYGTVEGGIICATKSANVVSCKNYGETEASMIWRCDADSIVNIVNCYGEHRVGLKIVSSTANGSVVNIKNYHCVVPENAVVSNNSLFGNGRNLTLESLNMENIFVEYHAEKYNLCLFGTTSDEAKANVKNILIKVTSQQVKNLSLIEGASSGNVKADGIIVEKTNNGQVTREYYGSNFSGFNISWRTGEINLNSMSSIGTFSPRLTEENLLGMGFEKKVI